MSPRIGPMLYGAALTRGALVWNTKPWIQQKSPKNVSIKVKTNNSTSSLLGLLPSRCIRSCDRPRDNHVMDFSGLCIEGQCRGQLAILICYNCVAESKPLTVFSVKQVNIYLFPLLYYHYYYDQYMHTHNLPAKDPFFYFFFNNL